MKLSEIIKKALKGEELNALEKAELERFDPDALTQRAADADQRVAAHADDVFIRRVRAKLEDGRARAVAEEHTGVSIGHIQNGTHLFRADDKGIALLIGQQQTARSFHCEQKARAGCADIHRGDVLRQTERSVNETGRARHDVFAGGGRHEHAADF